MSMFLSILHYRPSYSSFFSRFAALVLSLSLSLSLSLFSLSLPPPPQTSKSFMTKKRRWEAFCFHRNNTGCGWIKDEIGTDHELSLFDVLEAAHMG